MANVQWFDEGARYDGITVVSAGSYPRIFVCLSDRVDFATAILHWVPHLARSIPHVDTGCCWCEYPKTVKTYVPVLQSPAHNDASIMKLDVLPRFPEHIPAASCWEPKVCEMVPSCFDLLPKLKRGTVFALVRMTGKLSKKVAFRCYRNSVDVQVAPFSVKPFLLRTWGMGPSRDFSDGSEN